MYQSLEKGYSPFYTFMFYSGYPHLRFYGPLFAFLGGLGTLLVKGNLVLANKILLFILHLVSAWAMFAYLRHRTRNIYGAAIGTLTYLLVPWRVIHIAVLANHPQSLIYLLLPLCFLAFDKLAKDMKLKHIILLSLIIGLAIISHIFYAVFVVLFLIIAFLYELRMQSNTRRKQLTGLMALAGLGAVFVSAFFLIPFLVEYQTHLFPQILTRLPTPSLAILFSPWSSPHGYGGVYLGLSNIVLVIASIIIIFISGKRTKLELPMLTGFALTIFLTFIAPKLNLGFLSAGLPGVRFLMFSVFFASVLVVSGYSYLDNKVGHSNIMRTSLFLILFAVLSLDCLPHLLQVHYSREKRFLDVRQDIYSLISLDNPGKVLDIYKPNDRIDDFRRLACYPAVGFLFGNLATPYGPAYYQFAPRSMRYAYPMLNLIATDLGNPANSSLSPACLKAIAFMGVTHIITLPTFIGTEENMTYVATKGGVDWDVRFLRTQKEPPLIFGSTHANLVLASNITRPLCSENIIQSRTLCIAQDWQTLLDTVEIDPENKSLNFIPVTENQSYESLPGLPAVHILESKVQNQQVTIKVQTNEDCFLRLALSYYPELRVMLDGKKTGFYETKAHFIYLKCPAGTHTIRLTAPLGLLRRLMLILSSLAIGICLLVLIVSKLRKQ